MKDTETSLPLTVEAVEAKVKEIKEQLNNMTIDEFLLVRDNIKIELYRDVLVCVRSGASHSRQLAEAALKLEEV